MDRLTDAELRRLMQTETEHAVSLLMPTHPAGRGIEEDRIRLKNLLHSAETWLTDDGVRSSDARKLLEPAQQLVDDTLFWREQGNGLALFLSPDGMQRYRVPLELPEIAAVDRRFHVSPLLPLVQEDFEFALLTVSPKQVRLFQGTRDSIEEVEAEELPKDIHELDQYIDQEKQLQYHVEAPSPGAGSERSAVFHGHGAGESVQKKRLFEFCRLIDQALHKRLNNSGRPLVIACDKSLWPIYREANTYPRLENEAVLGNPNQRRRQELHEKAWEILKTRFGQQRQQATERFQAALANGHASEKLEDILPAAQDGRIDTLFVSPSDSRWGRFRQDNREVELHEQADAHDEELVNLAAIYTYLTHGDVYVTESNGMPAKSPAAALYRY